MSHNAAFYKAIHVHGLLLQNLSSASEKEIQSILYVITCDPSLYTMGHPDCMDNLFGLKRAIIVFNYTRVKSGKFGHLVNSETYLQTVETQMRRLLMSRLIRIFTVCLVNSFLISIAEL